MELLKIRKSKKLTQWDMKFLTGINQPKISLIERGYIQPKDEERKVIAQALGVEVDGIEWPEPISKENV